MVKYSLIKKTIPPYLSKAKETKLLLKTKKQKIKEEIKLSWGKPKDRYRSIIAISKYFEFSKEKHYHTLTSQTQLDIDFEALFAKLDRTETGIGSQFLYNTLLHPTDSNKQLEEIKLRSGWISSNIKEREHIQYNLSKLGKIGTYNFITIFSEKNTTLSRYKLYQFLSATSVLLFLSLFFTKIFFYVFLGIACFNLAMHYILRSRNQNIYSILTEVFYSIQFVKETADVIHPMINKTEINKSVLKLRKFSKLYRFLNFGIPHDDLSTAVFFLFEVVKGIFLLEIHSFKRLYTITNRSQSELLDIYKYIGNVDMYISIASVWAGYNNIICYPTLDFEKTKISFVGLTHPLIQNCISNDLEDEENMLLTGSNMSGKSTFLRSVLVNSILSQTINLAFAEKFISPFVKQFSAIKIYDNLLESKSYYYEEILELKKMVEKSSDNESKYLFVIDEIFKGTNTAERIALSVGVLKYLSLNHQFVFASTHDLELNSYLSPDFKLYHFPEKIINGKLEFDYKLKDGGAHSRNAINIAEIEGYPKEVIKIANELAHDFIVKGFLPNK